MLLSTSSFNFAGRRHCLVLLGCALLIAAVSLWGYEHYLRHQGYRPAIIDSPTLWSIQREKANEPNALVFVGASRTQFGIDLNSVRQQLPDTTPVMLAVNGRYPLATLRHLASDPGFKGRVIVDIDARGLHKTNHAAQQEYGQFYDSQWTPNWKVHRYLLNLWQARMALARPAHSIAEWARRYLSGSPPPFKFNAFINADRTGNIDFDLVSPQDLADHFAQGLKDNLKNDPPPPAAEWLKALNEVPQWVRAIESRGGKVIFYEPPVRARQLQLADAAYPRKAYWDAFLSQYGLTGLTFRDFDALQKFRLPDESHIHPEDKAEYTKALITTLIAEKILEPEP